MVSILLIIRRIYPNQFKCSYLTNKKHSQFLAAFVKFTSDFKILKKRSASSVMHFQNYRLRNKWLVKCFKSPVLEQPSTVNMIKCPKHCWNLHGGCFIILFHQSERTSVRKSLPFLMTSILFIIGTISDATQMQLSKKQKIFSLFFAAFLKLTCNFEYFEKKGEFHSLCISQIIDWLKRR